MPPDPPRLLHASPFACISESNCLLGLKILDIPTIAVAPSSNPAVIYVLPSAYWEKLMTQSFLSWKTGCSLELHTA